MLPPDVINDALKKINIHIYINPQNIILNPLLHNSIQLEFTLSILIYDTIELEMILLILPTFGFIKLFRMFRIGLAV